jgi:DNA repair protein RecN (Recombination protein N)
LLKIISEISSLKKNEKNLKEKLELNRFQLKEINAISPEKEEDTKLEKELNILENSEKLFDSTSQIYSAIYEDETCAYDLLVNIKNKIDSISRIDDAVKPKTEEINSALELIRDVGDFMRDYRDKIEIDPSSLDEIRERAGAIHLLKKKYGGTLENVLVFKEKIEEELSIAENFSENIGKLEKEANEIRNEVKKYALKLSENRKKEAKKVEKEIENALNYLGIADSKFEVKFNFEENLSNENYIEIDGKKINTNSNGIDIVEFYISTNAGEDVKPLAKTASGGEISRTMLAIKSVMAKTEKLPLLVFDEIDTGISGRIAQKVGKVLQNLSASHQIISITHLPQIAACADHHYSVQKKNNSGRVVSFIKKLEENEKINEIASLLSGEKVTKSNIEAAKELISLKN